MGKHGDGRDPRTLSPFRPGAGTVPPALVGRDADLEAIEDAIAQVAGGEPPQVALFVGERGMGKTVLLRRCEQMAREAGGIVLRGEMAPHADLQRAFATGVQRAQEELKGAPQRIGDAAKGLLNAVRANLSPIPGLDIDLGVKIGENRRPFLEALHDLNNAAHKHGRFLALSIDEIHSAEPDELRQLAAYIQLTHEPNNPLLVFGAGLPETREFIKEHLPTYARQRWSYHEIGELSIEESRAAITVPLRDRDVAIASDALDELVSISGQYPYFIQGFAAAAWKQHFASTGWQYRVGDTITHDDVKASIPRAERQLQSELFKETFDGLSPRECAFVLGLADLKQGAHSMGDVAAAVGKRSSAEIGSVRDRLIEKNVIRSVGGGKVQFYLPLMDRYVRDNRETFAEQAAQRPVRRARGALEQGVAASPEVSRIERADVEPCSKLREGLYDAELIGRTEDTAVLAIGRRQFAFPAEAVSGYEVGDEFAVLREREGPQISDSFGVREELEAQAERDDLERAQEEELDLADDLGLEL